MDIRAFRGWRYAITGSRDIGPYIAPPYDVLSAQDKAQLLSACDKNIVAVDMPHVPPEGLGPEEVYLRAAARLERWKSSGLLRRDDRPAIYPYQQEFAWCGRTYRRAAVLCGVRATELGKDVIPHEHTFAGPKADRLKLTQCTRMQLSPVLGFHRDDGGKVAKMLAGIMCGRAEFEGELRGVAERLWVVTDERSIADFAGALRDEPAFIADGHHRYATALNYLNQLRAAGKIDTDHPANFVMFALVARDDPGMLILPTHRTVSGLAAEFSLGKLIARAGEFDWRRHEITDADFRDIGGFLSGCGRGAMAFLEAGASEIWVGKPVDPSAMRRAAPQEPEAWRALDAAILHKLIIEESLGPWRTDKTAIEYTPDAQAVLEACRSGRAQLGVCLRAADLAAVEAIARAGGTLPHKSTYFYPKLATGMVLMPLE
jgi:uncharacterized protein (DUF1015 family)